MTLPTATTGISAVTPHDAPKVFIREGFIWDAEPAYLFDIDGTLLRTPDRVHYDSFFSSVKSVMGHDLDLSPVVLHGNTDPGILRDAFRAAKLEDAQWQPKLGAILDGMRTEVLARRDAIQILVMPGVEEALLHLQSKGATLGVATGNLETIGWLKVELAGLRDWFTFGGFSDGYSIRSEMIAHAAAMARAIVGADASVCVVGDTPADIAAARQNSLPVIAVATGRYSFEELMQSSPDVCATTLQALLEETGRDV